MKQIEMFQRFELADGIRDPVDVDAVLEIDAYHASLARSLEAVEECVFC